jgi:hypothetical protein
MANASKQPTQPTIAAVRPTQPTNAAVRPTNAAPAAVQPTAPVLYVASAKATKPGTFFAAVQAAAAQPISGPALIAKLQALATNPVQGTRALVPVSKGTRCGGVLGVVKIRTNYAINHGFVVPVA